ncbi:sigma-70 family RNA polymerase sigma factor [Clostridium sp. MCC353]|uniref:sigma-70 family RNA polymerase sigma factor n=1 Tax=Clostridium sp. MCC353 TaxID=2592646 RepID=UPI001C024138|nr:sigma-70 family RNA polymerase sigma factor [Clostridium sp. MCC353]
MQDILEYYYVDNAKRLHKTVDRILCRYGGITSKDLDDFYSLANEVFADVLEKYDKKQSFDGFLYSCLSNKIKTEITKRNREKRRADRNSVSMDEPVGEYEETTIGELIASDFDLEKELLEKSDMQKDEKIERYFENLSKKQRRIVELLIEGFTPYEIRETLHLKDKEYSDHLAWIRSYENISILF